MAPPPPAATPAAVLWRKTEGPGAAQRRRRRGTAVSHRPAVRQAFSGRFRCLLQYPSLLFHLYTFRPPSSWSQRRRSTLLGRREAAAPLRRPLLQLDIPPRRSRLPHHRDRLLASPPPPAQRSWRPALCRPLWAVHPPLQASQWPHRRHHPAGDLAAAPAADNLCGPPPVKGERYFWYKDEFGLKINKSYLYQIAVFNV